MSPRPPSSTLFPYTTLFRSEVVKHPPSSLPGQARNERVHDPFQADRKSTRLNSSHGSISYAVFCLKKKTKCKNTAQQHSSCARLKMLTPRTARADADKLQLA